jgi:hypothetical protein
MYYIYIDKKTNRIIDVKNKIVEHSDNLIICEVENLPEKYDYLEVLNLRKETRVVKDAYTYEEVIFNEKTNLEETNIVEVPSIKEDFYTCDLKACFYPQPTAEELEAQKEKRIDERAKMLIRQKYELEDEFKIQRRIVAYPENAQYKLDFLEYNEYVEKCILKAKREINK